MPKVAELDRVNMRVPRGTKKVIEQAASLSGMTVTSFMVDSAYLEALRRIETHQRIILNAEQSAELRDMLDKPAAFNEGIARAFRE